MAGWIGCLLGVVVGVSLCVAVIALQDKSNKDERLRDEAEFHAREAERAAERRKEAAAALSVRRQQLQEKYGNEAVVDRILRGDIWQGQSAGQLTDARGTPSAVDKSVLKTKKKEVWKYDPGARRDTYGLRVTLENDIVVGWDHRD